MDGHEHEAGQERPAAIGVVERAAAVLLLLQVVYVALFTLAVLTLPPDTAAIDHSAPSTADAALSAVLTLGVVVTAAGGALLLGTATARTRVPRLVRVVWLAVVALGEVAVAVGAGANTAAQDFGPDTVVGGVMVTTSLVIVAASALAVRDTARPKVAATS